jgi:histone H2A
VKAGLKFSVGSIVARYLKEERYPKPLGRDVAVYIVVVLEYLAAEVLELAGNAARDGKNTRISTSHIQRVVRNDDELAELFTKVSG